MVDPKQYDDFRASLRDRLRSKQDAGPTKPLKEVAPPDAIIPDAPDSDPVAEIDSVSPPGEIEANAPIPNPEADMILSEVEQFIVEKANQAQGEPRVMLNILHNFLWENKSKIAQKMAKGIGK